MVRKHSIKWMSSMALIAVIAVSVVSFGPDVAPAFAATLAVHSGNILSAAQYDLYTQFLTQGSVITATLVCDEIAPGNRPLDPVLSVFLPGADTSNTSYAFAYNDDGFGLDDDPSGVDCNAFDSSRIFFTAPVTGTYTFRADGFGSSTGPYTLTISDTPPGCDMTLPITSNSVVGTFVADTPVYSDPGVLVSPPIVITAGKSYWVVGQDASRQYYAIYVSCSRVWVPVSSMGPNYDDVWQGRPLPTNVIEVSADK